VIIDNLDVQGIAGVPHETDAPLIVDPNAVLPSSVSMQCFQMIPGRRRQVSDFRSAVQLSKLPLRNALDSVESFAV
jgi:hypothetical protein